MELPRQFVPLHVVMTQPPKAWNSLNEPPGVWKQVNLTVPTPWFAEEPRQLTPDQVVTDANALSSRVVIVSVELRLSLSR